MISAATPDFRSSRACLSPSLLSTADHPTPRQPAHPSADARLSFRLTMRVPLALAAVALSEAWLQPTPRDVARRAPVLAAHPNRAEFVRAALAAAAVTAAVPEANANGIETSIGEFIFPDGWAAKAAKVKKAEEVKVAAAKAKEKAATDEAAAKAKAADDAKAAAAAAK